MTDLGLAAATAIVDAALAPARAAGIAPLAVVVLDAGAHLICAKREDGASLFRIEIAIGKATGALGMGFDTRELAKRANAAPTFYAGVMALTGAVLPSPGGVLIRRCGGGCGARRDRGRPSPVVTKYRSLLEQVAGVGRAKRNVNGRSWVTRQA